MKRVTIDWPELEFAFQNASWEANYYLDLETGEVIFVAQETIEQLEMLYEQADEPEDADTIDLDAALAKSNLRDWQQAEIRKAAEIEARYGNAIIEIPRAESRNGYADMAAFIDTVSDQRLQGMLEVAIRGRGAFRRFKDVLFEFPQEHERWFAFQSAQLRARIMQWLTTEGIKPTNPPQ